MEFKNVHPSVIEIWDRRSVATPVMIQQLSSRICGAVAQQMNKLIICHSKLRETFSQTLFKTVAQRRSLEREEKTGRREPITFLFVYLTCHNSITISPGFIFGTNLRRLSGRFNSPLKSYIS